MVKKLGNLELELELKLSIVLSLVIIVLAMLSIVRYNIKYPIYNIDDIEGDYIEFEYADKVDKLRYLEYRISEYTGDVEDRSEILDMLSILSEEDSLVAEILYEDFN